MATLVAPRHTVRPALPRPSADYGFWSWITTVDHKRIGILYGASALLFFIIGGVEALMMRLQLGKPDNNIVSADTFNQLFTMHGLTMIFLVVMPLSAAFFNYIVPLQIGARDVAFPRLNALSYWIFLFGAIMLNLGFFIGQAPDGGWFNYANLSEAAYSKNLNTDFWVLGIEILGFGSMAAGFNFFVTIINLRAPGMTMMRMPVFVWMTLVTSVLILLAFPPLTVATTELLFDRFYGTHFFTPETGGNPILWQHLFWVFGHPEVYILILPAMGIISEVLPTFSRKPLFGFSFVVYSGIAIAFLSFGVWSHHMFAVGLGPVADAAFAFSTMLIAIPTGVKIFNWIGTMWGGSIDYKTAMKFAVGFIAMFIIGGLSGVMHSSPPTDLQQTDTYFIVAHFHYVLFGGSILGLFAGLYYWIPKATGRMLNERIGNWQFWLMLIGFNVTFGPMHWVGLDGMPRRIYTYPPNMGWDLWNLIETIAAFVIALSVLLFFYNLFISLRYGERAPADPWDGRTLEWSIPSPPHHYNFEKIPFVRGRDAYWIEKYQESHEPVLAGAEHGVATHEAEDTHGGDEEHHEIHMPSPSYFPVVVGAGIFLVFFGLLTIPYTSYAVTALGLLAFLWGLYGWVFEPVAAD